MPSAIMLIRREITIDGLDCFICSVYDKPQDIPDKLLDIWELDQLTVDNATLQYLLNKREMELMGKQ
jgi:hypothetical protein